MGGNKAASSEKELKILADINKVAVEYSKAKSEVKKGVLYTKLFQKCLANLLHVDGSKEGPDLEEALYQKLEKNEDQIADKYINGKIVDTVAFYDSFKYALEKYCRESTGDFTRLFLSTYAARRNGNVESDIFNKTMHGYSVSEYEKKKWKSINRLIETIVKTDDRFADYPQKKLSEKDLNIILAKAGVTAKDKKFYMQMAQKISDLQQAVELDKTIDEDGTTVGEYFAKDKTNVEDEMAENHCMMDILTEIVNRASNLQKRYFYCFITIDIFNHYSGTLSERQLALLDKDFWGYLKTKFNGEEISRQVAPDSYIAEYLGVQKPAITKQRQKYRLLAKEVSTSQTR